MSGEFTGHRACFDPTCIQHNGRAVRNSGKRVERTRCLSNVRRLDGVVSEKCHLCPEEEVVRDPLGRPVKMYSASDNILKMMEEQRLKGAGKVGGNHGSCGSETCAEHKFVTTLCACGAPSRTAAICHICQEASRGEEGLMFFKDWANLQVATPAPTTWGPVTHPGECNALGSAGVMLHQGLPVNIEIIIQTVSMMMESKGCSLCGERMGERKLWVIEAKRFRRNWVQVAELCSSCGVKDLVVKREGDIFELAGNTNTRQESASNEECFLMSRTPFAPKYRCVHRTRGVPYQDRVFVAKGNQVVTTRDIYQNTEEGLIEVLVGWEGNAEGSYEGGVDFADPRLVKGEQSKAIFLVDANVFGRELFPGLIDPTTVMVILSSVVREVFQARDPDAQRCLIFHLKHSRTIFVDTNQKKDAAIIAKAAELSCAVWTLDKGLIIDCHSRGISVRGSFTAFCKPRSVTYEWVSQMGSSDFAVITGGVVKMLSPDDKDSQLGFWGFSGEERSLTGETAIKVPEIPEMEDPVCEVKDLTIGFEEPRYKMCHDEGTIGRVIEFVANSRGKLGCTMKELDELAKRIEASLQENSIIPEGFREQDLDSVYPVGCLADSGFRKGICDIIEEAQYQVPRPDWDDKAKFLTNNEKNQMKAWDSKDVQMSAFDDVSEKFESFMIPDADGFTPTKRELVNESNRRSMKKPSDSRALSNLSKLFWHTLNLIKGKAAWGGEKHRPFYNKINRHKQALMCDFGFGNQGIFLYKNPGRLAADGTFWLRLWFIVRGDRGDIEGFYPYSRVDLGDGLVRLNSRALSITADKLAYLSNLYANSTGLRNHPNVSSQMYTMWFFANIFSGSRLRRDISMIKFATTAFQSDFSSLSNLHKKYLKGIRRRPIERLILRRWSDVVEGVMSARYNGENSWISFMGTADNLVDYIDLGNCHILSYIASETRHHLMSESIKGLRDNARQIGGSNKYHLDDKDNYPEGDGTRAVIDEVLSLSCDLYFDRADMRRQFRETPITIDELTRRMEETRTDFMEGPKSSYWHSPTSAYTNSLCSAFLSEESMRRGRTERIIDLVKTSMEIVSEIGYSLGSQAFKPQHDAEARAIIVQWMVAKILNWPHQALARIICEASPTELTSKSASEQREICQNLGEGSYLTMMANEDMASWSPSDRKEKFCAMTDYMAESGVIDEEVRSLLRQVLVMSDKVRIIAPAPFASKTNMEEVNGTLMNRVEYFHRGQLTNLPFDRDSFGEIDGKTRFDKREIHTCEVGLSQEEYEKVEPKDRMNYFVFVVMTNGWMQGLFHFFSTLCHDWQITLEKAVLKRVSLTSNMTGLVHSDDKNTNKGFNEKPSSDLIIFCEKLGSRIPELFGLMQSLTKSSITMEFSETVSAQERAEVMSMVDYQPTREPFCEFLGHFNRRRLIFSSVMRNWSIMNGCVSDDPVSNHLAIISGLIGLLNSGEDPCLLEKAYHQLTDVLVQRFGVKGTRVTYMDGSVDQGFLTRSLLKFGGKLCSSIVETRRLGTQSDTLWKVRTLGTEIRDQLRETPLMITSVSIRKKMRMAIDRLANRNAGDTSRVAGLSEELMSLKGTHKYLEVGLGMLGMGIGSRFTRWKLDGQTMTFGEVNQWSVERGGRIVPGETMTLNPKLLPLMEDKIREMGVRLINPLTRVEVSEPIRSFFGAGEERVSVFDITTEFKTLKRIVIQKRVTSFDLPKARRLQTELTLFINAYSINTLEGLERAESLWELHRNQQRFSHIVSSQHSGWFNFPHAGIKVVPFDGNLSPEEEAFMSRMPTLKVRDAHGSNRVIMEQVQDIINREHSRMMTEVIDRKMFSSDVNLYNAIAQVLQSHGTPKNLSDRGFPLSTRMAINSVSGGAINLKVSEFQFVKDMGSALERYHHTSSGEVINIIVVDPSTEVWDSHFEMGATIELMNRERPGWCRVKMSIDDDNEIRRRYGSVRAVLSWDKNEKVIYMGKDENRIVCEVYHMDTGSFRTNMDITKIWGRIEPNGRLGRVVREGTARLGCNTAHGPSCGPYAADMIAIGEKVTKRLCNCNGMMCVGGERRFCTRQLMFIGEASRGRVVKDIGLRTAYSKFVHHQAVGDIIAEHEAIEKVFRKLMTLRALQQELDREVAWCTLGGDRTIDLAGAIAELVEIGVSELEIGTGRNTVSVSGRNKEGDLVDKTYHRYEKGVSVFVKHQEELSIFDRNSNNNESGNIFHRLEEEEKVEVINYLRGSRSSKTLKEVTEISKRIQTDRFVETGVTSTHREITEGWESLGMFGNLTKTEREDTDRVVKTKEWKKWEDDEGGPEFLVEEFSERNVHNLSLKEMFGRFEQNVQAIMNLMAIASESPFYTPVCTAVSNLLGTYPTSNQQTFADTVAFIAEQLETLAYDFFLPLCPGSITREMSLNEPFGFRHKRRVGGWAGFRTRIEENEGMTWSKAKIDDLCNDYFLKTPGPHRGRVTHKTMIKASQTVPGSVTNSIIGVSEPFKPQWVDEIGMWRMWCPLRIAEEVSSGDRDNLILNRTSQRLSFNTEAKEIDFDVVELATDIVSRSEQESWSDSLDREFKGQEVKITAGVDRLCLRPKRIERSGEHDVELLSSREVRMIHSSPLPPAIQIRMIQGLPFTKPRDRRPKGVTTAMNFRKVYSAAGGPFHQVASADLPGDQKSSSLLHSLIMYSDKYGKYTERMECVRETMNLTLGYTGRILLPSEHEEALEIMERAFGEREAGMFRRLLSDEGQ